MSPGASPLPVLYSFRRCPYAMRARMAIRYSSVRVQLREVTLKDKPAEMLSASPKATVPVLVLNNGSVLDESLDIMHWALRQHDPEHWLTTNTDAEKLIQHNDLIFKLHLDHYKYSDRFPEHPASYYRQQGEFFLQALEQRLQHHAFLFNHSPSIADIAIFPFIRQFAYVDINWFNQSVYSKLIYWLQYWLDTELFQNSMNKQPQWTHDQPVVIF